MSRANIRYLFLLRWMLTIESVPGMAPSCRQGFNAVEFNHQEGPRKARYVFLHLTHIQPGQEGYLVRNEQ